MIACGGLDGDGRWVSPKRSPTFLFPVRELSKVYRSKFLDALAQASQAAKLPADPASTPEARQARLDALLRHDWVVYAKTPPAGPEVVLDYLSRYTHRVAISNQRIVGIDERNVHLSVRSDDKGGKRVITIAGAEFVGRFLQHVLPHGFDLETAVGRARVVRQGVRWQGQAQAALRFAWAGRHGLAAR